MYIEQNIYWLDLNKSFPIDGVLSSNSFELTQASTESGWQVTGTFFKSHSTLYSFGRSNDDAALGSLAAFDTATSQWSTAHVAGGDFNHGARHMNMHATGGPGLGFIAGGSDTDLRGMIQFNASNPSKLSWANQTGESVPNTMGATMQYVRMGRAGVLVAIGGYDVSIST